MADATVKIPIAPDLSKLEEAAEQAEKLAAAVSMIPFKKRVPEMATDWLNAQANMLSELRQTLEALEKMRPMPAMIHLEKSPELELLDDVTAVVLESIGILCQRVHLFKKDEHDSDREEKRD